MGKCPQPIISEEESYSEVKKTSITIQPPIQSSQVSSCPLPIDTTKPTTTVSTKPVKKSVKL